MAKFFWTFYFLLIAGFSFLRLNAQNIISISPGASGGSYGSVRTVHQDILAMFGNEAGLAWLDHFAAYASAERRFNNEGLNFYSLVAAKPTRLGTFGLAIFYHGFENYNEQLIGLAYGRKLIEQLAIGARFNFVQANIPANGRTSSLTAEIGIQSKIATGLVLGFHMYNPFEIEWLDQEVLPSIFNIGIAYEPTLKVRVVGEVEKISDFRENFKLGVQYAIIDPLSLRIGFNTNPSIVTFGIGYNLDSGFSFDVGSSVHQELGFSPLGGFGYAGKN